MKKPKEKHTVDVDLKNPGHRIFQLKIIVEAKDDEEFDRIVEQKILKLEKSWAVVKVGRIH